MHEISVPKDLQRKKRRAKPSNGTSFGSGTYKIRDSGGILEEDLNFNVKSEIPGSDRP